MTLDYLDRLLLRRRFLRATKQAEHEYIKLEKQGSADADDARERWALLFHAAHDAITFKPSEEAD